MPNDGINANTSFDRAAQATLSRLLKQMSDNLPGTVRGDDIEALHDMRVASRRLRSALRVFRPCFSGHRYAAASQQVREVTRTLGQVRDQDVLLGYLNSYDSKDNGIHWIIERESRIREGARMRMLDSLRKMSTQDAIGTLSSLLAMDNDGARLCPEPFAARAQRSVGRRLAILEGFSKTLSDPALADGHHRMRIAAKRLRYTMEVFIPCFGPAIEEKIASVKSLQEHLGRLHDCDVWVDKLSAYMNEPGLTTQRTEALTSLISHLEKRRMEAFESAGQLWKRMRSERFGRELTRIVESGNKPKNVGRKVGSKLSEKAKDKPAKDAAETKTTSEWGILNGEKTEPATANPPSASPLAEAVAAAREFSRMAALKIEAMGDHPKLARQIEKLGSVLDQLEASQGQVPEDAAAKLTKWLLSLEAESAGLSGESEPGNKKLDKLRDRIRTVRRKIANKVEAGAKA